MLAITNLAGEYEGKIMTWEEMAEVFPSKWVYVTGYEMDGPDIVRGKLIGVVTDEDNGDMCQYCEDNGIDYIRSRTTDDSGYFTSDGYRIVSEIVP